MISKSLSHAFALTISQSLALSIHLIKAFPIDYAIVYTYKHTHKHTYIEEKTPIRYLDFKKENTMCVGVCLCMYYIHIDPVVAGAYFELYGKIWMSW